MKKLSRVVDTLLLRAIAWIGTPTVGLKRYPEPQRVPRPVIQRLRFAHP